MQRKAAFVLTVIVSVLVVASGLGLGLYFGLNKQTELFVAIHCEPGSFPKTTDYPEQYWPSLVSMMHQADSSDVKLTLLFNPQWATFILQNSSRLTLLRSWETNGHEVGLHVHGPNMSSWCGYTDQAGYASDPKYIGTIDAMMTLMNQLPAGEQIQTCCVGDADIEFDYPSGVAYNTYGGSEKMNHLWSRPEATTINEQATIRVTHARYGSLQSDTNIDFEQFKELYKKRNNEYVMGLIWHVFNYADSPLAFIQLFEYLQEQGIQTRTVSTIVG